jgi:phosphatidylglycerophosphatase A
MQNLSLLLLSALGSGFLPKAPGTFGSAVGNVLFALGCFFLPFSQAEHIFFWIFLSIAISLAGIFLMKHLPRENFFASGYDQQWITLDEVAGVWIASLPVFFLENTQHVFFGIVCAFILFRFFDILKPLGIKKIDNLHTPFSVFADDIVAGVYAAIILGGGIFFLFCGI